MVERLAATISDVEWAVKSGLAGTGAPGGGR
jgi:hypothetical protein